VSLVVGGTAAASADSTDYGATLQAASAAVPAHSGDSATATSNQVKRRNGRAVAGSAVATSSSTCDGCSAAAITMQVIYARTARSVTVDNVAAAWSSCQSCTGMALSLQVVIAAHAGIVTANNRSLALNVACMQCATAAAAVQIVIVSPSSRQLSGATLQSIAALRDQLTAELAAQLNPARQAQEPPVVSSPSRPTRAYPMGMARIPDQNVPPVGRVAANPTVTATVAAMQDVLAQNLAAISASHEVDLRTG
jgi:hypothetical protein